MGLLIPLLALAAACTGKYNSMLDSLQTRKGQNLLMLEISNHALFLGSPLPESETFDMETVLDVFQEFVANPNPYMEAFGVRAKRHSEVEDHSGFTVFPIPFLGVEVGVKYVDPSNVFKGGEAYLHVDDLKSLIPLAHSKLVKLHVKFDGGSSPTDGLFNYEVDYHLEHSDGHGTEEGMLKIVRELRAGKWHTNIKTESHPFAGGLENTIIPGKLSSYPRPLSWLATEHV